MNRKYFTHTLFGMKWRIYGMFGLKRGSLGSCDTDKRRMHIPVAGMTKHDLDTIIHEVLHLYFVPEFLVELIAKDITSLLWKLKWRKREE